MFEFIWSGKPDKVKRKTMINQIDQGGLKVIHLESFIDSLKLTWVEKIVKGNVGVWQRFIDHYLKAAGNNFFFNCNFEVNDIPDFGNPFLMDICKAWSKFSYKTTIGNYGEEIIWNNSKIKIDNEIVFYRFLHAKGVDYIHNFFDEYGVPRHYKDFIEKYNTGNFPFTIYNGLIGAIPASWKHNIITEEGGPNFKEELLDRLVSQTGVSQWVYRKLISKIMVPPTALIKWNYDFSTDDWSKIFCNASHSVKDAKLHYFQFRFLHRILGTNHRLFIMKIKDNPNCTFCMTYEETIEHLFWDCVIVSSFLLDVETMFLGTCFALSKEDYFFGYKKLLKHPYNFLIYHTKFYVFHCKVENKRPCIKEFERKFRFALDVEKCSGNRRIGKRYFTYDELINALNI